MGSPGFKTDLRHLCKNKRSEKVELETKVNRNEKHILVLSQRKISKCHSFWSWAKERSRSHSFSSWAKKRYRKSNPLPNLIQGDYAPHTFGECSDCVKMVSTPHDRNMFCLYFNSVPFMFKGVHMLSWSYSTCPMQSLEYFKADTASTHNLLVPEPKNDI